jgi:hypothetical protein
MRLFNPFAVWSQVPLANRTSRVVRSIQNVSGSVAVSESSSDTEYTVSLGTTLTDTSKAIIVQNMYGGAYTTYNDYNGYIRGGGSSTATVRGGWSIKNTTTLSITAKNGSSGQSGTIFYNMFIVEFY